jgi:hypothetical protein
MPGLLRGVARVAAASGTATAVSNRVSRRQAARWSEQGLGAPAYLSEQSAAPAAAPPPAADPIQQLKELGRLHEQGVLTDEEFAQQKAKLLG